VLGVVGIIVTAIVVLVIGISLGGLAIFGDRMQEKRKKLEDELKRRKSQKKDSV